MICRREYCAVKMMYSKKICAARKDLQRGELYRDERCALTRTVSEKTCDASQCSQS